MNKKALIIIIAIVLLIAVWYGFKKPSIESVNWLSGEIVFKDKFGKIGKLNAFDNTVAKVGNFKIQPSVANGKFQAVYIKDSSGKIVSEKVRA